MPSSEHPALTTISKRVDFQAIFMLVLAVALGAFVRLDPVLSSDFPLYDGGFFYTLVQDLRQAHFALPTVSSYNSAGIPFAYPPLFLYVAAFLAELTRWPLLEIFRFFPAAASILTIPAFYLLSRAVLPSKAQATLATFAFAFLPRSFIWLIMGGGLTRAPGLVFALLALHQAQLLYTRQQTRFVWTTALFAGLAVLSHPTAAWFVVYSSAILFLFYGRSRKGVYSSLMVAAGVLLVTAPWWLTMLLRHGPAPLLAAAQTGNHSWYAWFFQLILYLVDEPYVVAPLMVVGLLGLFACFVRKEFLLPLWLLAIFIVDPRASRTLGTVPLAMLAGIGLDQVILPGVRQLSGVLSAQLPAKRPLFQNGEAGPANQQRSRLSLVLLSGFLVYALLASWLRLSFWTPVQVLSSQEYEALNWVAANTAETSRFLVIATDNPCWNSTEEWFPALTGRVSLATVQGYEWLPDKFTERTDRCGALLQCTTRDQSCLEGWAEQAGFTFTHVYIPKERAGSQFLGCCPTLEYSLHASSDYRLIYDGSGAKVFARAHSAVGP